MIRQERSESAFNATEDLLLVPMPVGLTEDWDGFAGQVMRRFPIAQFRLKDNGGLRDGEAVIIGRMNGEPQWVPAYSLALCGLHRREQNGWTDAPRQLETALDLMLKLSDFGRDTTVATAGIPGTGFSGVRGSASPEAIRSVLQETPLAITIYQDNRSGDRARVLSADPTLDDAHAAI